MGQLLHLAGARDKTTEDSVAIVQFQARNPRRHIGQLHSMALNEFYHEYTTASKGKPCQAVERAWIRTTERLRAGQPTLTFGREDPETMRAIIAKLCESRRPLNVKQAAFALPVTAFEGEAQPYLDAMDASIDPVNGTSNFVSVISSIVTNAESNLPPGEELDAVYELASVAVDSYNHWVVGDALAVSLDSLNQAYGGCVKAQNPNECLWETRGPIEMREPVIRHASLEASAFTVMGAAQPIMRYASTKRRGSWITCSSHYSVWGIVKGDVGGGAFGRLVKQLAVGALTGSAGESLWQHAGFLACVFAT